MNTATSLLLLPVAAAVPELLTCGGLERCCVQNCARGACCLLAVAQAMYVALFMWESKALSPIVPSFKVLRHPRQWALQSLLSESAATDGWTYTCPFREPRRANCGTARLTYVPLLRWAQWWCAYLCCLCWMYIIYKPINYNNFTQWWHVGRQKMHFYFLFFLASLGQQKQAVNRHNSDIFYIFTSKIKWLSC